MDLLVTDDLGLCQLDNDAQQSLLEVIDGRSNRATIVVSQLPVGKCYATFTDPPVADVLLDRLLANLNRFDSRAAHAAPPLRGAPKMTRSRREKGCSLDHRGDHHRVQNLVDIRWKVWSACVEYARAEGADRCGYEGAALLAEIRNLEADGSLSSG